MGSEPSAGSVGRVTGAVRPGRIGEAMIAVGDRVEAFYAVPFDGHETIDRGAECVVVERHPSLARTLLVTAMPSATAPRPASPSP